MNKRIDEFDIMRLICSLWIVGFLHMKEYIDSVEYVKLFSCNYKDVLTFSVLGCFSFISGYLNYKRGVSWKEAIHSIVKRLFRIYPVYLVSCLLMWLIGYIKLEVFLRTILLIGEWTRPYPKTLWYINMILIFNIASVILNRFRMIKSWVLILLVEIVLITLSHTDIQTDVRMSLYWPIYALGNQIHRYISTNNKWICNRNYKVGGGTAVLSAFVHIAASILHDYLPVSMNYIAGVSLFVVLLYISRIICTLAVKNKILIISKGTMCAYLFHRIVYWGFQSLLHRKFPVWFAFLIAVPVLFICALFVQKSYDVLYMKVNEKWE